jgi:hypothetical protein
LPSRKYRLHQKIELPGLTKEAGFIGGNRVDHLSAFLILAGL